MSDCPSARIVIVENEPEQVQCIRYSGHPGDRHRGFLSDLSVIEWTGAPSSTSPTSGETT